MKFTPYGDRIAVRVIAEDEVVSEKVIQLKGRLDALKGEIVGVGQGIVLPDGSFRPSGLREGQLVTFAKLAGSDLKLAGKPDAAGKQEVLDLKILRLDEVMGVVDYEDESAAAAEFPEEARTA
jgi:chaperonin GroES